MGRVSIQLKIALGLSILILVALLWKIIPEPLQDDSLWTDKIVHLLIFMILAISYLNAGTQGFQNFKSGNFGKALGATALFSILTEALQLLVPWRHGDFMDLAANILGVGLAGIMVNTMHSVKKTV
jgi:glycopeptide antibiotics resistance protein|tara:strand:- start:1172 stop:1549 length:378 start_codon:yes stop_codon:yes gene_type:complete